MLKKKFICFSGTSFQKMMWEGGIFHFTAEMLTKDVSQLFRVISNFLYAQQPINKKKAAG